MKYLIISFCLHLVAISKFSSISTTYAFTREGSSLPSSRLSTVVSYFDISQLRSLESQKSRSMSNRSPNSAPEPMRNTVTLSHAALKQRFKIAETKSKPKASESQDQRLAGLNGDQQDEAAIQREIMRFLVYPDFARKQRLQGMGRFILVFDPSGKIETVRTVSSTGSLELDRHTEQSLRDQKIDIDSFKKKGTSEVEVPVEYIIF
jgi:outer membrane biosynthesis protein TonB